MSSCALRISYLGLLLIFLPKTEVLRRGELSFALVLFFLVTSTEPWWYSGDQRMQDGGGREIKIKQEGKVQAERTWLSTNRHQNLLSKK